MAEDVKDSVIEKTQKTLGKHITKPTLTPKLLKKPPFRFLHDIVTSVIKDTGFLKGLFKEQEMVSENVKEREAKIAFLTKLINAIGAISGNELDIKPGKIVAGLEPTKTNKLLQTLGGCLDKKLDSVSYVTKLNSPGDKPKKTVGIDKASKSSRDVTTDSNRKAEKPRKPSKINPDLKGKTPNEKLSKTSIDSTRKETDTKVKLKLTEKEKNKKLLKTKEAAKNKETTKNKDTSNNKELSKNEVPKTKELSKNIKSIEAPAELNDNDNETTERIQEDIPSKVLEESKDVSLENHEVINMEIKEDESLKKTEIPRETSAKIRPKSARIQPDNVQKHLKEISSVPTNFLRPPSVRPTSARPGAPRLRPESTLPTDQVIPLGNINVIVENYNNQDDEETVVIQNVELPQEQPSVEDVLNIPQDKGHLVEQILEQINDSDDFTQLKNEENVIVDTHNRDVTQKEIHQLQSLVQTLTKVANPLGKLMNYLHEDLDGMHSELTMWVNMKKQAYADIRQQKQQQSSSNAALKQQLHDVEENIKKIESEIAYVQANVLRNDVRIKQLLTR